MFGSRPPRKKRKAAKTLPVFYRSQSSKETPDQFLSLEECKKLKASGMGDFINRGMAFRRFDVSQPHDPKSYQSGAPRGESLRINPAMMMRYAAGDIAAIEAVESWA